MTMAYLIDSKIALKKTGDAITILKLTSNIDLLSHQYHQHPNPNNPPIPPSTTTNNTTNYKTNTNNMPSRNIAKLLKISAHKARF